MWLTRGWRVSSSPGPAGDSETSYHARSASTSAAPCSAKAYGRRAGQDNLGNQMRSRHLLADELNRERLAHAEGQRLARQFLAARRATRRAHRRVRNAVRHALRLRTELKP